MDNFYKKRGAHKISQPTIQTFFKKFFQQINLQLIFHEWEQSPKLGISLGQD